MVDQTQSGESVIVLGAGMAGLATALALKNSGRSVVLVERDGDATCATPEQAFDEWERPGVAQLHHTHIFLARLRTILRDQHPELLEELHQAGLARAGVEEVLPPGQVAGYTPEPGDDDLLHLWGRRATFEYVLRRHVARLPNVRFVFGARIEGLRLQTERGQLRVIGVELKRGDTLEQLDGSIVVDATGQHSKCVEQLRAAGAKIQTFLVPSMCAYYCRHYLLDAESAKQPRGGTGTNIDYLIAGLFFAERDTFSVAFTCREDDEPLKTTLRNPDGFDRVCEHIPNLARWTTRAEPLTKVLGGAGLKNRWHHFSSSGSQQVLGFFPVGDSHIQTNPIYGRGCSMAFVQAHALADALAQTEEPVQRSLRYHAEVKRLLKPHFEFCVNADRTFWARTKRARGEPLEFRDRLLLTAYDNVVPTVDRDRTIAREWLRGQQMLKPAAVGRVLATLCLVAVQVLLRKLQRASRPALEAGPERAALLEAGSGQE
ncbi:MAG TPA: FAD-dependent oxidoreductase [Polyangiales bacterium]|nr:FAD-dependent oxidoreductase [Polyangiales bacterium]